ncbi:hypothetical protein ZHAS_00011500 [Anopheles sinensis]|uniref:Uncharacterized protein n=1 Tax=Anopheles sinensis TaxID=74873 RepID=A0A084W0L8_ANOSI|nr:hypothetical protein ZHAS_00011500 [Anopheles sinensis]
MTTTFDDDDDDDVGADVLPTKQVNTARRRAKARIATAGGCWYASPRHGTGMDGGGGLGGGDYSQHGCVTHHYFHVQPPLPPGWKCDSRLFNLFFSEHTERERDRYADVVPVALSTVKAQTAVGGEPGLWRRNVRNSSDVTTHSDHERSPGRFCVHVRVFKPRFHSLLHGLPSKPVVSFRHTLHDTIAASGGRGGGGGTR